MTKTPYQYHKKNSTLYHFVSKGRRRIDKAVEFAPIPFGNLYNLAFGDLLVNGDIDDLAISNNGDILKLLSTIIYIVKNFTKDNPAAKIYFKGSPLERTALYQRIIKNYISDFKKEFVVAVLVNVAAELNEVDFDPKHKNQCVAFFVKRKLLICYMPVTKFNKNRRSPLIKDGLKYFIVTKSKSTPCPSSERKVKEAIELLKHAALLP